MRFSELARRLTAELRPMPWAAPVIIFLGLICAALEGLGLYLFIPLVQSMGGQDTGGVAHFFHRVTDWLPEKYRLASLVGALCLAILLKNVVGYVAYWVARVVDGRVAHRMRLRIFERTLWSGADYAAGLNKTDIINTLTGESWRVGSALGIGMRVAVVVCTCVVFVTLLLLISVKLTFLAVGVLLVGALVTQAVTRKAEAYGADVVEANRKFGLRMWESVDALRLIRSFTREPYERARFEDRSEDIRRRLLRLDMLWAIPGPIGETFGVMLIGALILAAGQVGGTGVASLAAFLAVLYRLQGPARELVGSKVGFDGIKSSLMDVFGYLDLTEVPAVKDGTRRFVGLQNEVAFETVSFNYPKADRPAVHDVSFVLRKGTTTAIVGRSGAGKSTLIDLLFRFRDPVAGRILVDGEPLDRLRLDSWRGRLSVMSQDVHLFNETARANIAYGKLGASDAEIEEAARIAGAHDFIAALPRGYDTPLGDRGVRLSGGQRQRIALARTILRDPDVLLLDEATNALDSFAERAFQTALERWAKGRTVVVIAHRLSTIERADQVIVMEEGEVIERGTPQELLSIKGLFADMHAIQTGRVAAAAGGE
ncbi:ABC transporter ATP-binding protein [Caulobacter sp. 17J65-9]|nr:ABC transporter ATP-binding protein [Caulobacter sp. 17J65-9]